MRRAMGCATRRLVVGAAIVATVVGLAAGPASAHYNYIYHGDDFASINSSHTRISVCNQERDGTTVRADVRTSSGVVRSYADTSENGTCATYTLVAGASAWRLCEVGVSCRPTGITQRV